MTKSIKNSLMVVGVIALSVLYLYQEGYVFHGDKQMLLPNEELFIMAKNEAKDVLYIAGITGCQSCTDIQKILRSKELKDIISENYIVQVLDFNVPGEKYINYILGAYAFPGIMVVNSNKEVKYAGLGLREIWNKELLVKIAKTNYNSDELKLINQDKEELQTYTRLFSSWFQLENNGKLINNKELEELTEKSANILGAYMLYKTYMHNENSELAKKYANLCVNNINAEWAMLYSAILREVNKYLQSGKKGLLTLTQPDYNFGIIESGKKFNHRFVFKNVGEAPVVINKIGISCKCTVVDYTKVPILPGKSAFLNIEYTSDNTGVFAKQLFVHSTALNSPMRVSVKGFVKKKI